MKVLFITLFTLFVTMPAFAADTPSAVDWLKPVEAKKVCMVNNKAFDQDLIAVQIDGKTYYGCCPMCKGMLEKDASQRTAVDPVSGKSVDKATALIGADTDGNTYYFESQDNLKKFAAGPKPETKHNTEMPMQMPMEGMK